MPKGRPLAGGARWRVVLAHRSVPTAARQAPPPWPPWLKARVELGRLRDERQKLVLQAATKARPRPLAHDRGVWQRRQRRVLPTRPNLRRGTGRRFRGPRPERGPPRPAPRCARSAASPVFFLPSQPAAIFGRAPTTRAGNSHGKPVNKPHKVQNNYLHIYLHLGSLQNPIASAWGAWKKKTHNVQYFLYPRHRDCERSDRGET